jgi:hypothetical protein
MRLGVMDVSVCKVPTDVGEKHCSIVGGFVLDYLATFDLQLTGMESSRLCSHSLLRVKEI